MILCSAMRLLIFLLIIPFLGWAQYRQPGASEILLKLKKLNFLGSVLYVAAHPDDENTRVIAYLANERLATTAYLSMTRGDGGQNLIGPEMREELGVIRTHELLAARKIDGGEQFFTRANDFGFSKSEAETLSIWGKEAVLSDVVRIIRQFQPDVVINRFPPDQRAGHGHHTASAVLSIEAFELAARPEAFAELGHLKPWQPTRLYFNTGRFFSNTVNETAPGITVINVGGFNTLLGKSYAEIAAESRSQHKSQGFGSAGRRGNANEFFELIKGMPAKTDIFDGINTSWTRLKGGEKVPTLIEKAIREFNPEQPHRTIPQLFLIRQAIQQVEEGVWKQRKLAEVNQLIADCLGLFAEVTSERYWVSPEDHIALSFEIINRAPASVVLKNVRAYGITLDSVLTAPLAFNEGLQFKTTQKVTQAGYSAPYWLREPHSEGLYTISDPAMIGKPTNDPALQVIITLEVMGQPLVITVPVVYKWTDPVKGELYRPVEVTPPLFLNLKNGVLIFPTEQAREIAVTLKGIRPEKQTGIVYLELPEGWRSEPAQHRFDLAGGQEQVKVFRVTPPSYPSTAKLRVVAQVNGQGYSWSVKTISYNHIPIQTLMPAAEMKLVRIDLKKEGNRIGYVRGAGDDIPAALRNMGYEVWEMQNDEVTSENLKTLDAVVVGVRALNANESIEMLMPTLLEYVKDGGVLIMQYNTTANLATTNFAPYPLTLSRTRVTEEQAEVTLLMPDHPLLNIPNKITASDFADWVQERGLYFPGSWHSAYQPLLSMHDKNEPPAHGSLLVAQYDKGFYIYTSLAFFRQLPEGVPGAYRLFANLVSACKTMTSKAAEETKENHARRKKIK